MEKPKHGFENLNKAIHKNLQKLFQARKGVELSRAEIRRLYEANFSTPDVMWVQPSDHAINMHNSGACSCSKTDEAIFERVRYGLYRVR